MTHDEDGVALICSTSKDFHDLPARQVLLQYRPHEDSQGYHNVGQRRIVVVATSGMFQTRRKPGVYEGLLDEQFLIS